MGIDPVQAFLDQREHAEGEEVDLDEAGILAGILVPLADVAAIHGGGLDRHDFVERGGGDDHAADVLGDVPGEVLQLLRDLDEVAPRRRVLAGSVLREAVQFLVEGRGRAWLAELGDAVEIGEREAERLADIAHGAAQAIGGEGADEGGVIGAVDLVDPFDHLLADFAREVDIDVGDREEVFVQEAAEVEVVLHRVDRGEPDQVADDRADRRTAAAASGEEGAGAGARTPEFGGDLVAEVQEIAVDQEESGEVEGGDRAELFRQSLSGLLVVARVFPGKSFPTQASEAVVGRLGAIGAVVGKGVVEVACQVEPGAAAGDELGGADRLRDSPRRWPPSRRESAGKFRIGAALAVAAIERGAVPDCDEHVLQVVAAAVMVVDVAGGNVANAELVGEVDEAARHAGYRRRRSFAGARRRRCPAPNHSI